MRSDQVPASGDQRSLRPRLAWGTAFMSLLAGYSGRGAYAGGCAPVAGSPGSYLCSGAADAATDVPQGFGTLAVPLAIPVTITTEDGFGIDTANSTDSTFGIFSTGGLSFRDDFASAITSGADDTRGAIDARNFGSGAITITSTGHISSLGVPYGDAGIYARNHAGTSDLTIGIASLTTLDDGVRAHNYGSGQTSVTASGAIDVERTAVSALSTNQGDVSVSTASITSSRGNGIGARTYGGGSTTITATGVLTVGGYGIGATSGAGGLGIDVQDVDAARFSGSAGGIRARTYGADGSGDLTVSAGPVSAGGYGVDARNDTGRNLSITVAGVTSSATYAGAAISAHNSSNTGTTTVTSTGAVSGGSGIDASASYDDLTIDVQDVSGAGRVVFGAGFGIAAATTAGDLSITAGKVISKAAGVHATNVDGGALRIDVGGVTSDGEADGAGIYASNRNASGPLTITTTGAVSGATGIEASTSGSDLTIIAQDVTSTDRTGFGANAGLRANAGNDGQLQVQARDVYAFNYTGVSVSGRSIELDVRDVSSAYGDNAIVALGRQLDVTARNASGRTTGIRAFIAGGGAAGTPSRITSTGALSGSEYGVYAFAIAADTDLEISVNDATGTFIRGIEAFVDGGTNISITTTGMVSGGIDGIRARTGLGSTGNVTVTSSGAVTGGTGQGIETGTEAGRMTTITLESGASVSAASGGAITNNGGDSQTLVKASAAISGAVSLGDGSDDLTFDGGDFSGVTGLDGGANTGGASDALAFRNVSGSLDGDILLDWETLVVGSGSDISVGNTLNVDQVSVGGHLGGNATIGGQLVVGDGGSVGPGNSAGTLISNGLTMENGGTLTIEVFSDSLFDLVQVLGDVQFDAGSMIDLVFDVADPFDGLSATFLTAGNLFGFDNITFGFSGLNPGYTARVSYDTQPDALSVSLMSRVPEPGILALFASGLLSLIAAARARGRGNRAAL